MIRTAVTALVALATLLTACGDGDGGSGGSDASGGSNPGALGEQQRELVELTLRTFDEQGFGVDRPCVEALAGRLNDLDARRLVAAYPDGDPEVTASGRAIGAQLLTCADHDDLVDAIVTSITSNDARDEACLRGVLDPLDSTQLAELLQSSDEEGAVADVVAQLLACGPAA